MNITQQIEENFEPVNSLMFGDVDVAEVRTACKRHRYGIPHAVEYELRSELCDMMRTAHRSGISMLPVSIGGIEEIEDSTFYLIQSDIDGVEYFATINAKFVHLAK